jgi:hypothetical protein
MSSMRDRLGEWVNQKVTLIIPESYIESVMKDVIRMEKYEAMVTEIGDDFVRLKYEASKKKEMQEVDQVVPLSHVKRLTVWGGERFLQL